MGGSRSEFATVESGVPQHSVVRLTLFLLYIKDLPEGLTSRVGLFADDMICQKDLTCEADQCLLQQHLNRIAVWEKKKWKMSFNPKKRSTLQMTRRRKKVAGSVYRAPICKKSPVPNTLEQGSLVTWDGTCTLPTSPAGQIKPKALSDGTCVSAATW